MKSMKLCFARVILSAEMCQERGLQPGSDRACHHDDLNEASPHVWHIITAHYEPGLLIVMVHLVRTLKNTF